MNKGTQLEEVEVLEQEEEEEIQEKEVEVATMTEGRGDQGGPWSPPK